MSQRIPEFKKAKVNPSVPLAEESDFKRSKIFILILSLIMLIIAGQKVSAQTILAWNPASPTSLTGYGPSPWTPTTPNSNLTVVGLTRGSGVGISGTAAAGAWGCSIPTANVTTSAAAITGNQFVTFSITANSTFKVSLSTLDLFYRRSAQGAASGLLQYAIGAGAYTDITTFSFANTTSSGAALPQVSLSSVSALQNVASGSVINFRIVLYGNGTAGGTWYVFSSGLSIGGTVASAGTSAVLSDITTQPNSTITQGNNNIVLAGFKITPAASVNFTAATVTGSGTATATDLTNVRIFRDNDGNGLINGADASVSGTGVSYAASMPVTVSGETGFSTVRNYLIVANVAGSGVSTVGHTVTASIGSGAFTTTATSNTGSVTGSSRTISAPTGPVKLVVTAISPASPFINSTFDVTVQAQDAANNPQSVISNTDVVLSKSTGTGILSGTLTGTINAGSNTITFTGLTYNVAEAGVSLSIARTNGDALTTGTSSVFTVQAVATQLGFAGVPSTGSTGVNLTSFTVQARKPDNSIDANYTGAITVSLNSGPGTLTGTLTVNAVAGVATFNNLQLDQGGTVTLKATASGLTQALSGNIVITVIPTVTEVIFPKYAINGNTTGSRLQYLCRLRINNLSPSTTYRYVTSAGGAGNIFVINNTSGAAGYITGYSSNKSLAGVLTSGDEFSSSARYGELTTDATGTYTGWFSMVPTSNAVFAAGNAVTFSVQLNDGANGTTVANTVTTASNITMLNPASGTNGAQAIKGTSSAPAESMIFFYDNTNGNGRPLFGTWTENDGIPSNFSTWYNTIEATNGAWGAYIPVSLPTGLQRIEYRDITTGAVAGCVAVDSDGVWPTGNVNTVNPAGGTTPLVISNTDAPLVCPILNTITTGTVSATTVCIDAFTGAIVSVPFTSTDIFNAGNIYKAQLSDASGSFASPVIIGTLASTANSGTINAEIPGGTLTGTGYRIRVISTDPSITGTNNGSDIAVTSGTGHYIDVDGDGYGDDGSLVVTCTVPNGYISVGGDCDDFNPDAHPGATEVCDDVDNDCNTLIDEGLKITFYADADADTYGNAAATILACSAPDGYVADNTDCNDANAAINPGETEICNNAIDDNCNNSIDEGCSTFTYFADADNDTYGDPANFISSASATPPAGYVTNNTDCDDTNAAVHPGVTEICNGIDDNCINGIDDGLTFNDYYSDNDQDNFGGTFLGNLCSAPLGSVTVGGDCDDSNASVNPGVAEICNNGIDDNCNSVTDETTLAATETHTAIACNGGTSTVTISATGGTAPYTGTGDFPQTAGTHLYVVSDAGGCTSSIILTTTEPAAIGVNSFVPASGSTGIPVVITGSGFTGATGVKFNGTSAITFTVNSNTQITATIPAGATTGLVTVIKNTCSANSSSAFRILTLTDVIVPQYIQGLSGTNSNRVPYAYRVSISGLLTNATYRYYNQVVISTDGATTAGAGNVIFANAAGFYRTTSPSLSSVNNYGTFTTDVNGTYEGWFVTEATGNARFAVGNNVFMRIVLNDGGTGTSAATYLTTNNPATVINFVSGAGATNGTALRGASSATAKNFVFTYDNVGGTGRAISGTYVESDGFANTTANSFASFYATGVDGVAGAYGLIIPNANANGIRRIEQRDLATGLIVGCVGTDADGVWPGGANTVNPVGGTTPLVITNTDAPLSCPVVNTITTGTISGSTFCADAINGASVSVPFTSTDVFNAGNIYTAQLSNAAGSFASPVTIGTLSSIANSGTISATIAAGTLTGTGYRIRVISSDPAVTGTDNGSDISITTGTNYYADADGDNFGSSTLVIACAAPAGYVSTGGDCDDANPNVNPGATEICDNIDNNCDTQIDEGVKITFYADADNDTYGNSSVTVLACSAPAGYVTDNTDCNDTNAAINPGVTEICNNGIDDNCNNATDEGCSTFTYFADADGDTYGNPASFISSASATPPAGYVTNNTDCDDANAAVHPGATELCNNGIDDDCDNAIDETTLAATESHSAIACNGGTSTVTISATGGNPPYTGTGDFTQSAGTQAYTVTDASGCSSVVNVVVTQPTAITFTSFTPAFGTVGSSIVITGSGFTGTTEVKFNGVNAVTFTVNSNTQITAIVPAGTSSGLISVAKNTCAVNSLTALRVITLTDIIVPQYMQGLSGTNSNRIPYAYRVALNGLLANATYRYYNQVVTNADGLTTAGAGNIIFANAAGFVRTTGPSLSTAGNYGTFTTNASGAYSGWFITEPSGNARFAAGGNVFMKIILNDGGTGTTAVTYLTTNSSTTVINLVNAAGTANGTALRGVSSAVAKNFVLTYDNVNGTGRPLSGTFVESDGTANTTANSYASFYATSVDAVAGSYGMITPNTNANGIRRIEQRELTTGNILGCPGIDADGVWPGGANTVNPAGGTTALVITTTDANLGVAPTLAVTSTDVTCFGGNNGTVTLSVSGGSTPYSYLWSDGSVTQNLTNVIAGTYTVTVTPVGGCSSIIAATVNQPAQIIISSFTPASGNTGDVVTISGSGFTGTTAVLFNGINALFTVNNDGEISATVPAGVTDGPITVATGTCSSVSATDFTVTATGNVSLNLQLFLQGFYAGGGTMNAALYNAGVSTDPMDVDSVTVQLYNVNDLNAPFESATGILKTDGSLSLTFTEATLNGDFYIVVKQRNSIETWSKDPVHFSGFNTYDFAH